MIDGVLSTDQAKRDRNASATARANAVALMCRRPVETECRRAGPRAAPPGSRRRHPDPRTRRPARSGSKALRSASALTGPRRRVERSREGRAELRHLIAAGPDQRKLRVMVVGRPVVQRRRHCFGARQSRRNRRSPAQPPAAGPAGRSCPAAPAPAWKPPSSGSESSLVVKSITPTNMPLRDAPPSPARRRRWNGRSPLSSPCRASASRIVITALVVLPSIVIATRGSAVVAQQAMAVLQHAGHRRRRRCRRSSC